MSYQTSMAITIFLCIGIPFVAWAIYETQKLNHPNYNHKPKPAVQKSDANFFTYTFVGAIIASIIFPTNNH